MNCGRCGHGLALHGRRGHGACRHGHIHWLEYAVEAARLAVVYGIPKAERGAFMDRALREKPPECKCPRFVKRAPKVTH